MATDNTTTIRRGYHVIEGPAIDPERMMDLHLQLTQRDLLGVITSETCVVGGVVRIYLTFDAAGTDEHHAINDVQKAVTAVSPGSIIGRIADGTEGQ